MVSHGDHLTLFLLLLFMYFIFPHNCTVSSNCIFNSTNGTDTYNLTRLSRREVWKVQIKNNEFADISFCHPVHLAPCKDSTFCVSKYVDGNWAVAISNNGPYQLKSQENGRKVQLELEGKQKCDYISGNYSIQIYFTCSSIDEEPVVLGPENDGCLLLISWKTAAACPIVKECVLGDYDLSSLSVPTYYDIRTYNGRVFELNLCRNVRNSSRCHSNNGNLATACEIIEKDNVTQIIGQLDRQMLTVVQNAGLTLKYTTKSKGPKTVVRFICSPDSKNSEPSFVKNEGKTYYFDIETPLVCSVWPQECLAFDTKGGRFDLKPLRMTGGNWVVQSMIPGANYYINVCGPLNPILGYTGSKGRGLEACLIFRQNKTIISLGTVAGGPSVVENVLNLQYAGGSPCPNGGRHKAMIEFSCSNKTGEGPVYIKTTKECVHHFSWETIVACPTLLDIGTDCKVRELQYGYQFDLSILQSGYDKLENGYRISLCVPLEMLCNNKKATVCLLEDDREIAIGYDNPTIYYENGGLRVVTHGESCMENFNQSTVTVMLLCRHGDDFGNPELSTQVGCDFYFVWYTSAACPPPRFTPCTVEDNGNIYDLSWLTETTSNHVVDQKDRNLKFILNVCHSLVFGKEAMCEYTSGACMINMSDSNPTTRFTNIGDVTKKGPYIDTDKKLKLKYEQGKMCHFPNGPNHISTVITFECAQEDFVPMILPGDVCMYEFLWKTRAACPVETPKKSHASTNGDCTVVDPLTQNRFDLRPLRNEAHTVSDMDGHNYTFVVCGNLTSGSCDSSSGVCQEKVVGEHEHWNAGVGNSKLEYRPHALLLEYKDGSPCKNNLKRSTTIEFVCADEASEQIVFIEETQSCSYLISWHTRLACSRSLYEDCFVSGTHSGEVDLAPLIGRESNYVVKMDQNTVFFINICRSLLPVQKLGCSEGPSICMAHTKDGNFYDEKNIGFYEKLEKQNVGRVSVIYNNGPGTNATAEINLECNLTSGIGEPQFQSITKDSSKESKYNFLWKTNVTCEPHEIIVSPNKDNCIIHNDQLDRSLNLRELGHNGVIEVYGKMLKYVVDFCGSINAIQHTEDGSFSNLYGTLTNITFYYQQQQASLHFTGGIVCSGISSEKSQSEVLLNCAHGVGSKIPAIFKENDCNVIIEWQNPLVCELLIAGYPRHVPHIQEDTQGSSVGMVIGLIIVAVVLCSLFVYFRKPSNRSQLRSRLSSLFGIRHSEQFHYSRLEAADEASQLLASHMDGQESDSDDELLRM